MRTAILAVLATVSLFAYSATATEADPAPQDAVLSLTGPTSQFELNMFNECVSTAEAERLLTTLRYTKVEPSDHGKAECPTCTWYQRMISDNAQSTTIIYRSLRPGGAPGTMCEYMLGITGGIKIQEGDEG